MATCQIPGASKDMLMRAGGVWRGGWSLHLGAASGTPTTIDDACGLPLKPASSTGPSHSRGTVQTPTRTKRPYTHGGRVNGIEAMTAARYDARGHAGSSSAMDTSLPPVALTPVSSPKQASW
ncbi:hypothetical protein BU16DRAFT_564780 [Lophium mytilinum]|uniref:Uncharacterized protein n=1 Tax=Lophium mytilinum TaxID=390894 RepID=A0A6A6QJU1_9PEZI|nr:hypothetical protein BU16DRAFT_564780 [Lophium mytilinum]